MRRYFLAVPWLTVAAGVGVDDGSGDGDGDGARD